MRSDDESHDSALPFESTVLYQLRLVARIALGVSLVAALGLLGVVVYLGESTSADSYLYSIESLAVTRQNLASILFGAGLVLVGTAGMITWLLSLHSSTHIAGPLYRFARDLEQEIAHNVAPRIRIRASDALHREAWELQRSIDRINEHHVALLEATRAVERQLDRHGADAADIAGAIDRLVELESRMRLDE